MVKYLSKLFLLLLLALVGCQYNRQSDSDLDLARSMPAPEKNITVNGPNDLNLELIYIKPGRFTMGRNRPFLWLITPISFFLNYHWSYDSPAKKVTITKGFYIGKYKVTVAQYCKFLNSIDSSQSEKCIAGNPWTRITKQDSKYLPKPGVEDCAVNTVPWYGANAFCKWLSDTTGHKFRLPTDAEWEFTARGPGNTYPEPKTKWSREQKESWMGPSVYSIAEKYPSNVTPDGVVGMRSDGGIGEWVSDYFDYKHSRRDKIDPTGPKKPPKSPSKNRPNSPPLRVLRRAMHNITDRKYGYEVGYDAGIYGFRVLMEVDEPNKDKLQPHSH
ncbi:MAG: formylglycine-generating enzyme family protein [Planctomycetes bacterium]|nr:formylglycine-generating enzyme family protein [Planctomycetota bacterium]